jgi:hypothetical protein
VEVRYIVNFYKSFKGNKRKVFLEKTIILPFPPTVGMWIEDEFDRFEIQDRKMTYILKKDVFDVDVNQNHMPEKFDSDKEFKDAIEEAKEGGWLVNYGD